MLSTGDFIEKFNKGLFKFNDYGDIFHNYFKDKENVTEVENAEDYKIFKIQDVFYLFTKRSWKVFKLDYK